jgi:hypothetical protein
MAGVSSAWDHLLRNSCCITFVQKFEEAATYCAVRLLIAAVPQSDAVRILCSLQGSRKLNFENAATRDCSVLLLAENRVTAVTKLPYTNAVCRQNT